MRCSALAHTSRTCDADTPAAASSSSTARMATGRIGPNDPVVWSSKAIVTRAPGRARSRSRGRPERRGQRVAHRAVEVGERRERGGRLAGEQAAARRQGGGERAIGVRQVDAHAAGDDTRFAHRRGARVLDCRPMAIRLAAACLMGWAATTNYTNHAAVIPLLMAELHFGPVQAGLLSTAFFVTLAVACVPAGMLSDRLGPTGVGTAGLVAVFASNLALGWARDFPDLLLIKVVGGLGCGLAFVAGMRYAALVVPPARVPRALGLYGGFVQLGGGTSLYLIPLLASHVGWRRAFVISSALIALATVGWLALAPRVRPSLAAAPLTEAVRSAKVWTLGLVHTATFGLAVLIGIWVTTFLVHDFGLSLVSAGAAGSAILALGVLSRPLGGLWSTGACSAPARSCGSPC